MIGQPSLATAVRLVREAIRLAPVEHEDPVEEMEAQQAQAHELASAVAAAVEHLDEAERLSLITSLARVGMSLALVVPQPGRDLWLSMLAGEAERN